MKSTLTISRKWNNPQIRTTISTEGISLDIDLDDFINAVVQELGPVTWVFRDQTFRQKLDAAVAKVLSGVKEESAKVV